MGMFTDLVENKKHSEDERFELNKGFAEKRGLSMSDMFSEGGRWFGNYVFKKCGHSTTRELHNIRNSKGVLACKICSDSRATEAEVLKGLVCIGASSDGHILKRRYRIVACGHNVDIFYSNLHSYPNVHYKCDECNKNYLTETLTKFNIEFVEKSPESVKHLHRPNTYNKYKRIECGHTFDMLENRLKYGVPPCSKCEEIAYFDLLKQRGLELIGDASDTSLPSRFKSYKFVKCGHFRDIDRVCVTRDNFICHECNDSYLNNPSNIYLFKIKHIDFTFLKLGYGKNPKNRIREYGLLEGSDSQLLYSFPVINGRVATKIELDIHSDFTEYKLPTEKMKYYMRRTGYTECYPVDLESVLLTKMQEVHIKTKENNE